MHRQDEATNPPIREVGTIHVCHFWHWIVLNRQLNRINVTITGNVLALCGETTCECTTKWIVRPHLLNNSRLLLYENHNSIKMFFHPTIFYSVLVQWILATDQIIGCCIMLPTMTTLYSLCSSLWYVAQFSNYHNVQFTVGEYQLHFEKKEICQPLVILLFCLYRCSTNWC